MTKLPPILKQSLCGSKREKTLPTSAHVKRERNWTLLKRLKRGSSGRPFYFSRSRCSGLPADLPIHRPRPPVPRPSPMAMAARARPPCRPILITHAIQFSSIRRCETRLPMKRAAITRSSLVPPARPRAARADARPAAFFIRAPSTAHGSTESLPSYSIQPMHNVTMVQWITLPHSRPCVVD